MAEKTVKEDVFDKKAILHSKRFAERRDALSFLLEDGKGYTISDVNKILDDYMKEEVK